MTQKVTPVTDKQTDLLILFQVISIDITNKMLTQAESFFKIIWQALGKFKTSKESYLPEAQSKDKVIYIVCCLPI